MPAIVLPLIDAGLLRYAYIDDAAAAYIYSNSWLSRCHAAFSSLFTDCRAEPPRFYAIDYAADTPAYCHWLRRRAADA